MASTAVNPTHYNSYAIQPIQYIQANKLSYEQGNVVKYITRFRMKGGLEDLLKAKRYIDLIIENEYKEQHSGNGAVDPAARTDLPREWKWVNSNADK